MRARFVTQNAPEKPYSSQKGRRLCDGTVAKWPVEAWRSVKKRKVGKMKDKGRKGKGWISKENK